MRRRAALSRPETIGEILGKILRKRNIPHTATDRNLLDLWRRAVGPQISARTLPETVKRGALHVKVSAPVWLHQLQFLKEEIIEKLHELSGNSEIRSLFFAIGEIPAPPGAAADQPQAPLVPPPLKKRDRQMVKESLESIRDPELRQIVERVMVREIGRRRELEMRKDR